MRIELKFYKVSQEKRESKTFTTHKIVMQNSKRLKSFQLLRMSVL